MRPFNSIYGLVHLVHQTSLSPLCRVRVACWRAQSNNSFVLHSTVDQGSKPNLSAASNLLRFIFWLTWTLGPSPRKSSYLRISPKRRVVLACYAPSPTYQSTEALCRIGIKVRAPQRVGAVRVPSPNRTLRNERLAQTTPHALTLTPFSIVLLLQLLAQELMFAF